MAIPSSWELGTNGKGGGFRNNYVFDACLLGFCDEITTFLMKKLSSQKVAFSTSTCEGKVYSNAFFSKTSPAPTLGPYNHPADRILLFKGALVEEPATSNELSLSCKEVAHCDECMKIINGRIFKCTICFDFDLCGKCYRTVPKKHYNGKHIFLAEN